MLQNISATCSKIGGQPVIWCLTPVPKRRKTDAAMKLKSWVVWLLVVTFLASEVLLFSALHQKAALQVSFQSEKQRAEQLETQLDQLKSSNAAAQGAEVARLRAENLDLPRLRNQITLLQESNQKLSQQLKATTTYAQQQQAQLKQAEAAQQAEAEAGERNACINILREIDAAKQQWALEKNKPASAVPAAQDLLPYFKDGVFPTCPSGGTYTLNAVGELPSCSVPGHELPQ
jgi:TolA-binding protein